MLILSIVKIGSYSLEVTISDGNNQSSKTYLIEVYDDIATEVSATDIVLYDSQDYNLLKNVTISKSNS